MCPILLMDHPVYDANIYFFNSNKHRNDCLQFSDFSLQIYEFGYDILKDLTFKKYIKIIWILFLNQLTLIAEVILF